MAATSQPPFVVNSPPRDINVVHTFKGGVAKCLGIAQIAIGVLVVLFEAVSRAYEGFISIILTGVWMGTIFIITGGIGILAANRKTKCLVIGFMVMSIIAAVVAAGMVCYGAIAEVFQTILTKSDSSEQAYKDSVVYGMMAGMISCGLAELVIGIVSAAICCAGACCCRTQPMQVMYISQGQCMYPTVAGPQQQVIMYQQQGQPAFQSIAESQSGMSQKETEAMAPQEMLSNEPPPAY